MVTLKMAGLVAACIVAVGCIQVDEGESSSDLTDFRDAGRSNSRDAGKPTPPDPNGDPGGGGPITPTDGGGNTTPPPVDSGANPNSSCTVVSVPNGTPRQACVTGPANQCKPQSVASYSPSWRAPRAAHQNKCSAELVNDYYIRCLGGASTGASCVAFREEHPECTTCLVSNEADNAYGPVIVRQGSLGVRLNVEGCIAVVEPCNVGCGMAYQAVQACNLASCGNVCGNDFNGYQTCASQAENCVCGKYVDAYAACQQKLAQGHPAYACIGNNDSFETLFKRIGTLFCGK